MAGIRGVWIALLAGAIPLISGSPKPSFTVSGDGTGDFRTVQEAVNAAPPVGAVIRIRPGEYREQVTVNRPSIEFLGQGTAPEQVVITFDRSNGTSGGSTAKSASVTITGDGFYAENLTFENSFSKTRPLVPQGSQAVALRVAADRAVFRRVRFLGHQDTLYADSKGCVTDRGPCTPARQYFADCYIEGNVDYIFGNALAYFDRCEIHSLARKPVYITAQSKRYEGEQSGYVFQNCRLTVAPGAESVYLGRPWRWYASVVFLETWMAPEILPVGWLEWVHDDQSSLPTVFYGEYRSRGPGANARGRESHSKQLSRQEAARFELRRWLAGSDGWDAVQVHASRSLTQ